MGIAESFREGINAANDYYKGRMTKNELDFQPEKLRLANEMAGYETGMAGTRAKYLPESLSTANKDALAKLQFQQIMNKYQPGLSQAEIFQKRHGSLSDFGKIMSEMGGTTGGGSSIPQQGGMAAPPQMGGEFTPPPGAMNPNMPPPQTMPPQQQGGMAGGMVGGTTIPQNALMQAVLAKSNPALAELVGGYFKDPRSAPARGNQGAVSQNLATGESSISDTSNMVTRDQKALAASQRLTPLINDLAKTYPAIATGWGRLKVKGAEAGNNWLGQESKLPSEAARFKEKSTIISEGLINEYGLNATGENRIAMEEAIRPFSGESAKGYAGRLKDLQAVINNNDYNTASRLLNGIMLNPYITDYKALAEHLAKGGQAEDFNKQSSDNSAVPENPYKGMSTEELSANIAKLKGGS